MPDEGDTRKESRCVGSVQFIGQISIFGFDFAPRGWALCDGQLLLISQNTSLFSLIGTTYGGDGKTTFALPNLQGRVPLHPGNGAGLSAYTLGQAGGSEAVTLSGNQIPAHGHPAEVTNSAASSGRPTDGFPATGGSYAAESDGSTFNAAFVGPLGGNQPHRNVQPYLAVNFCIALVGLYPSRD